MNQPIYPETLAEMTKARAGEKYRPSNGTEGDCYFAAWCCKCQRDKAMRESMDVDSVRSLPNRDLDLRDENLAMQTLPHLLLRGAFEKQLERLAQVVTRFLDGPALAGDIQFGTQCNEIVSLTLDDGRKFHENFSFARNLGTGKRSLSKKRPPEGGRIGVLFS